MAPSAGSRPTSSLCTPRPLPPTSGPSDDLQSATATATATATTKPASHWKNLSAPTLTVAMVTPTALLHVPKARRALPSKQRRAWHFWPMLLFSWRLSLHASWPSPVVLVAATIDAAVDMAISLLLFRAATKINNFSPTEYPRGRKMLEPIIVIGFAAVTCALTVPVAIEAITQLVEMTGNANDSLAPNGTSLHPNCSSEQESVELGPAVIVCFSFSGFVNVVLFAYCWCVYTKSGSQAVKALAMDFRNDSANFALAVIIICLCVSFPDASLQWLNQVGALLISLVILKTWVGEGLATASKLTGVAPPEGQLQDILALVHWAARRSIEEKPGHVSADAKLGQENDAGGVKSDATTDGVVLVDPHRHDSECIHVQQVHVYHFGSNLIVEVQLVMPGYLTTQQVAAGMRQLRSLMEEEEDVERCFVTLSETVGESSHAAVVANGAVSE